MIDIGLRLFVPQRQFVDMLLSNEVVLLLTMMIIIIEIIRLSQLFGTRNCKDMQFKQS